MEKKHQTQQKLDKIQAILRQNPHGIRITDLAKKLNVKRSTIYDYLNSVELKGKAYFQRGVAYPERPLPARPSDRHGEPASLADKAFLQLEDEKRKFDEEKEKLDEEKERVNQAANEIRSIIYATIEKDAETGEVKPPEEFVHTDAFLKKLDVISDFVGQAMGETPEQMIVPEEEETSPQPTQPQQLAERVLEFGRQLIPAISKVREWFPGTLAELEFFKHRYFIRHQELQTFLGQTLTTLSTFLSAYVEYKKSVIDSKRSA
jgi:transposase